MEWGVCTTALAPLPQILAFVAWHRHLGASHIWVHLDDADAVPAHILNQIDVVTAVLCDDGYWAVRGQRAETQEGRQFYNMRRVYELAELPVIAHLDVDQYLYPKRPMTDILDGWDGDAPFLRAVPAEALHDPALPDDIFTARQFRLPFPNRFPMTRRLSLLGGYALMLKNNMLSHTVGKSLFRTGIEGLVPRLHGGAMGEKGPQIKLPLHPDLMVLHFHAQDQVAWRAALAQRLSKGAYRFNEVLAGYLAQASDAEIDAFYEATQVATPELVTTLGAEGLLAEADLKLKEKVAALF